MTCKQAYELKQATLERERRIALLETQLAVVIDTLHRLLQALQGKG